MNQQFNYARPLYHLIARAVDEEDLEKLVKFLPSGSGIDAGCKVVEHSKNKLVIEFSFHHLNQNGYYDGWTQHKLVVKPILGDPGFEITITGYNRNQVKDYLYDLFYTELRRPISVLFQDGKFTYKDTK